MAADRNGEAGFPALLAAEAGDPEIDRELLSVLATTDDTFVIEETAAALVACRTTPALRVLLLAWSRFVAAGDEEAWSTLEGPVSIDRGESGEVGDDSFADRCAELGNDPDQAVAEAALLWREWWLYSPQPEPSLAGERSRIRVRRVSRPGARWPSYEVDLPLVIGGEPASVIKTRKPLRVLQRCVLAGEARSLVQTADQAWDGRAGRWIGVADLGTSNAE